MHSVRGLSTLFWEKGYDLVCGQECLFFWLLSYWDLKSWCHSVSEVDFKWSHLRDFPRPGFTKALYCTSNLHPASETEDSLVSFSHLGNTLVQMSANILLGVLVVFSVKGDTSLISASLAKAAQQSCCKQTWVHSAGSLLADHADNNIRKKNGSLSCDCCSSGMLPVCISLVASPLDFPSFLTEGQCFNAMVLVQCVVSFRCLLSNFHVSSRFFHF